jgi:DNA-binding NtrC family response regulator
VLTENPTTQVADAAPRHASPPRSVFDAFEGHDVEGHDDDVHVLIADNERALGENCRSILTGEGYHASPFYRLGDARSALRRRRFDIALIDERFGGEDGLEFLAECREANPHMIVVIMSDRPAVGASLEAFSKGAWEYLPKPFSAVHLQVLIGRATHVLKVVQKQSPAPAAQARPARGRAPGGASEASVVGESEVMQNLVGLAKRVATTDASVFLSGESGVGKEMFAQLIHRHSRRASGEMVAINCAALPENLLESEMFGHSMGAFTGAVRDKPGLLEIADGGTLFLDELTEMPLALQAKLLRVLQDGVIRRVGSETTDAVVNVRFIAATNRDPEEAIAEGRLRQDLYYRLRVVPFHIPSLRERKEDIPALAEHFLREHWLRHRGDTDHIPKLTVSAVQALNARAWHGNVRELQNVLEHAVVFLNEGEDLHASDIRFSPGFDEGGAAPGTPPAQTAGGGSRLPGRGGLADHDYHTAREKLLEEFERDYLIELVERAGGNMSKAARIAQVDRTTLYRLMGKHGFSRNTVLKAAG